MSLTTGQKNTVTTADLGTVRGLINSWRLSLRAKNRSDRTLETYTLAVNQFADFLDHRGMPSQIDLIHREYVEAFVEHMLETRAPATANQRYRSLDQFFKWAQKAGEIQQSPMANMTPPHVPEQPVPVVSDDDLRAVLATTKGNTFDHIRDQAILRIFIDTGARLSEVTGMALDDVDLQQGVVWVTGKGDRRRLLGLDDRTTLALDAYIRRRRKHRHAELPELWIGKRGALTRYGMFQVVKRRGRQARVDELHPHMLRHTYAHRWMREGGSEGGLRAQAGWRDRAMLDRYGSSAALERSIEEKKRLGLTDGL